MKHACKQATRLASDSLDRPLTLWERFKLKLHLSMCNSCRRCESSFRLMQDIHTLMRNNDYGNVQLSEQQRKELHRALDQAEHSSHPG